MIYQYHDHVCDECDSTIATQCDCSESNWPEEEYCKSCQSIIEERTRELEDSEGYEEAESDEGTEEREPDEKLIEEEARKISERL